MWRRVLATIVGGAGIALLAALLVAPVAAAGGDPDDTGDDPLDELRAEVPEGFPGEFDLTEADERFGRLVELYGESTAVADFGDGSELTGPCGGFAYSYDSDGTLIDAAMDAGDDEPPLDLIDGGQAFTSGNRFKVDTNGIVVYYGFMPQSGDGPFNHDWSIKTSGVSLDSGGDPNDDGKNRNAGLVDLADELPVKFNANAEIEGSLDSDNLPTCAGTGHIEFVASGVTPLLVGSIALLAGGIFGLLFNARPAMTYKV